MLLRFSPVQYAVYISGGVRKAAKFAGVKHPCVYQWRDRDKIPVKSIRSIVTKLRNAQLNICSDDLIFGKNVEISEEKFILLTSKCPQIFRGAYS